MKKLLLILLMLSFGCGEKYVDPVAEGSGCGMYEPSNLHFTEQDTLTFPLDVIYISPGLSYKFKSTAESSLTNEAFKQTRIQFKLNSVDTIYDDKVVSSPVNYKNYLSYINQKRGGNSIIQVVFPDETEFVQEYEGDTKKYHIHGAALYLGSDIYFVRDGRCDTDTNPHEKGHCFNLLHTFQEPDDSPDGLTCVSGDFIVDSTNPRKTGKKTNNFLGYNLGKRNTFTPVQIKAIRKAVERDPGKRNMIIRTKKEIDYAEMLYDL